MRPRYQARCLLAALVTACGGDRNDAPPADTNTGTALESQPGGQVATAYAPELGVDLNAMTELEGLRIRDLEPGAGDTASAGDRVRVDYTGWLPNGVQFDSSDGNPIAFTLGVGEVIDGWDLGVAGMRVGGRRMLVIPPAMAYGERGRAGVIPPNATLVFDVRLVDVTPDTTGAAPPGGS